MEDRYLTVSDVKKIAGRPFNVIKFSELKNYHNLDDLFEDIDDKLIPFMELQKKYNMTADNFAYIGDDDFDIPLLEEVGFSCCPANAMDEVKKHVNYVCKKNGGEGAIREVIDLFLKAKNLI